MDYRGMRGFGEGATGMDELGYELWHACAGPLTSLPPLESLVMYWPQGHIEQVVACTPDSEVPDDFVASKIFQLPSRLLCKISKIELQADPQTDDVFAQMDLTPQNESQVTKEMREAPPPTKQNSVRSFCKTLTASDTSTHGGFSVPRRAAEECFPLLDYNMNPPCQELVAKDLHGKEWNFRHIYRGHPRRHLLTTGWSVFVSQKRLVAGDTVIFLRGENGQLRVGVRRASKQLPLARSTYFSSANVHLGVLAAASHAAKENIRFCVIYNPRTSPSDFVIPYHKFLKAEENHLTVGCRFKMKFESDESTERRYLGTITEIGDVDPSKWPESSWRSMKVEWDESTSSGRHERVSPWEIEPFVPISTLPPPPVGARHKRRPPTPVTDLSPLGTSQSVLDSFQSNKLARILPVHDLRNEPSIGDEEDGDAESSRNSSWVVKEELPLKTGLETWFPRQDASSYVMSASPYQHSSRFSVNSASLEQAPSNGVSSMAWATFGGPYNLQPAATFPAREPHSFQALPSWLASPKLGDVTASSSLQGSGRTILPTTSLNNDPQVLPAQPLSFDSWDKVEHEKVNTSPALVRQCKLFGFNLIDKAVPVPVPSAPSHCDDSEGSGLWPTAGTDHSSPTFEDQHFNKLASGASQASTSPLRSGTKVLRPGNPGRIIDLSKCDGYVSLRRMLTSLFNLEGEFDVPEKGWWLVYVDHENDVLLVGDDPWKEFCSCVRGLMILSPTDVLQLVGKLSISSSIKG